MNEIPAKTRILVIDDSPINLRLATSLLEARGYEVYQAMDSHSALLSLERSLPSLILMDLGLPGIDGFTLTRRLKADRRFRRIPVVAVTALEMLGDRQAALAAGCDGYICKPLDTRRLATQIQHWLVGRDQDLSSEN